MFKYIFWFTLRKQRAGTLEPTYFYKARVTSHKNWSVSCSFRAAICATYFLDICNASYDFRTYLSTVGFLFCSAHFGKILPLHVNQRPCFLVKFPVFLLILVKLANLSTMNFMRISFAFVRVCCINPKSSLYQVV